MSPGKVVAVWTNVIIVWILFCSGWWYASSRDDYAKLAAARACYSSASEPQSTAPRCVNIKPADMLVYKVNIDHRALISRLAGALGAMAAIGALILGRRQARNT